MDGEKLMRWLRMIEGIEDLDAMLDARERLRRVYSFLIDAYRASGKPIFLTYARHISGAGGQLNLELDRWVKVAISLHGDAADEPAVDLKERDADAEATRTNPMPDL